MSPTHKPHPHPHPRPSAPTPISASGEHKSTLSNTSLSSSSSVPSLPDVHKPPSGAQWGFLQTLLDEDQQERDPGQFHPPDKGGRRNYNKTVNKSSRDDCDMLLRDKSDKRVSGETLTARSDKLLTASWSGTRGTADTRRRGERRRHSRDSTASPRQLSGSTPSKKKFKNRMSHSRNPKPLPGSRRFSSPGITMSTNISRGKSFELGQKCDSHVVTHNDHEQTSTDAGRSLHSGQPVSESDKPLESSRARFESESAITADKTECSPCASQVPKSRDPDSETATLPSDSTQNRDNGEGLQQTTRTPPPSSTGLTSQQQDNTSSDGRVEKKTATTITTTTQDKTPIPSDPINQWTTCRALDDSGDDDDTDDDNNNDDNFHEGQAHSESWTQEAHRAGPDSSSVDGIFTRATSSSHLARRKRPLLLPPIMLPPIYTVKPTPLKLRDEMYFASGEQRARRPISDEEWDKLRDCRYLRIRTLRTIKV